jgi:hypothetical protein
MSTLRCRLVAAACVVGCVLAACGSAAPSLNGPSPTAPPSPAATAAPSPTLVPSPAAVPSLPAYLEDLQALLVATTGVGSARIAYEIGLDGSSAAPDGALMSGTGDFATGDQPLARIDMDMSAAGLGKLNVIQDGDMLYMKGDAFKALDPAGRWIRVDSTSDHPNAVAFSGTLAQQSDPWAAMYYLLGATAAPETLAPDTIDGTSVRHLGFRVDMDAAIERAPADARDYLLVQAENARRQGIAPVFDAEVWADDANRIRRVAYRMDLGAVSGGGQMVMGYEMSDFGVGVDVKPPDPADTVDIEDLQLSLP